MAKLAFIEKSKGEYWNRLNAGVYNVARKQGDVVRIYAPMTVNPEAQLACFKAALDDHPDAIVLVASDSEIFRQVVENTLDSGIPVLTMDLDGYSDRRLFHFGTLPYPELGCLAAEEMLMKLKKDGPIIVQAGSYAPGASGKLQGFCNRIAEANRQVILIDPDFENPKLALSRVVEAIEENPDVAGLYGVYAYHSIIQAQAVALSGYKPGSIPIIGFDMLNDTVKYLSNGSISSSIWIREYYIGANAAIAASLFASYPWDDVIEFLGGSVIYKEKNIRRLPICCYSKSNVSNYVQWLKEHK